MNGGSRSQIAASGITPPRPSPQGGANFRRRPGVNCRTAWADRLYDGNHTFGGGKKGEYRERTLPVDGFAANPWGLYQVHGNVWEWCGDVWNDNYTGTPTDGSSRLQGDDATN